MTVHSTGLSPGDLNTTTSSTPSTGTPPSQGTRISPGIFVGETDFSRLLPNVQPGEHLFHPAYHVFIIVPPNEKQKLVATIIFNNKTLVEHYRTFTTIPMHLLFSLHIADDAKKYYHLRNCLTQDIFTGEVNTQDAVQVGDGKSLVIPPDELHVVVTTTDYDELVMGQQVSPPVF